MRRSRVWLTVVAPVILMCGGARRGRKARAGRRARNGARTFESACASCHGNGGTGGDRGPSLVDNRRLRAMSAADLERIIRGGTPNGMPAFPLPSNILGDLTRYVQSLNTSAFDMQPAGNVAAGERFFFGGGACATCHTVKGSGEFLGPDLSAVGKQLTLSPAHDRADESGSHRRPRVSSGARQTSGRHIIEGFARNEGNQTLPLQTTDGSLYSLEKGTYTRLPTERASLMPALKATPDERRDLIAY